MSQSHESFLDATSGGAHSGALQTGMPRRRWQRALTWVTLAYALAILVLAVWLPLRGDRGWAATIFLFGPRWFCALPMLLLVPLAGIWRRWLLLPLAGTGGVILWAILGLEMHLSSSDEPYQVRIMTCNVNQLNFATTELAELVARLTPDIVALQEVPYHPPPIDWPRDWHVVQFDKTIVASRHPISRHESVARPEQGNKPLGARFLVALPVGEVQLFNLHLTTPRGGLSAVVDRRAGWNLRGVPELERNLAMRADEARLVRQWIASFAGPKFVVGDFNMPPESVIFRETFADFASAFGAAGFGLGYTKQTGRGLLPYGTRIDHILYTPPWRCVRAWLAADVGSDHLPLVADFAVEE